MTLSGNSLKPWAQINLSFPKFFVSGVLSQYHEKIAKALFPLGRSTILPGVHLSPTGR